jgi:hypothetical protein
MTVQHMLCSNDSRATVGSQHEKRRAIEPIWADVPRLMIGHTRLAWRYVNVSPRLFAPLTVRPVSLDARASRHQTFQIHTVVMVIKVCQKSLALRLRSLIRL